VQVEFARLAGVGQSVISAYESGRRQPAPPTLTALVRAAGLDLAVSVRKAPDPTRVLAGPGGRIVRRRRRELVEVTAAHGASNLRVFGSIARGQDRPDSDVDPLADLPAAMGCSDLDGWTRSWSRSWAASGWTSFPHQT
jgi:transcriptional regulator with XRE-family HTH domain